MYINDTHILYYTVFGAIGFIVGCLASWFNTKLPEYKKILSKERYNKLKENIVPNYFIIIANVLIYIALGYIRKHRTVEMFNNNAIFIVNNKNRL